MITIVLFQYSVVVHGIEMRLKELGFEVNYLTEKFDRVAEMAKETKLFLLYLPRGITDDRDKLKQLSSISHMILDNRRKLIYIAERDDHEELLRNLPETRAGGWVDRPVDNEVLGDMVIRVMEGAEDYPKPLEKKRILIVDDDPVYAGTVREWIKDTYKADVVTAGMKAITFLMKNPVDLILLDYEMPIVDGPQVLQMLRQEDLTKDIPVVFLTAVSTKEGVKRVMALKPMGYILKSTTREELLAFLKKKL